MLFDEGVERGLHRAATFVRGCVTGQSRSGTGGHRSSAFIGVVHTIRSGLGERSEPKPPTACTHATPAIPPPNWIVSEMNLIDEQIAAARATFANELTSQEQIRLIREVFDTREELFLRAWPTVVALGYGRRRRRAGDDPEVPVDPTPCLTFVVDTADSGPDPVAGLPASVFAYATVSGIRRLCAIPTDIDPRVQDKGFRAERRRRSVADRGRYGR